jgi:hypothetical protein
MELHNNQLILINWRQKIRINNFKFYQTKLIVMIPILIALIKNYIRQQKKKSYFNRKIDKLDL